MTTKKLLAGHSLTYRNVVMLATPGDVGHGWGCRGNSNGGAPRGCPEVDGCYSVWFEFLWRFPGRNRCVFFQIAKKNILYMIRLYSTLPWYWYYYILNYFGATAITRFQLTNPPFRSDANHMPLLCCHVFGRPMASWTWKRCVPWLCRRSRCQVETPKPRGSMGLVYLPTWMVDFYGKCR